MGNLYTANASLAKPIPDGIDRNDSFALMQAVLNNADLMEKILTGVQPAATTGVNASVINTNGNANVLIQVLSAACISSITGAVVGLPFNLIFQSVGSTGMADVGAFKLNGAFNPNTNACLRLVWDGTNFIEISRSTNG